MTHNAYDDIPYASHAFEPTSIEHLYTMGRLFGLKPTDPEQCSVLEIGCSLGGNLFPMAVRHPQSRFVGIDLSKRQIELAKQAQAEWEISNIEFRAQSLVDLTPGDGTFDYVIVHGIFSWVDHATRQHILRACQENLNVNGLSYVSYNTKPGWNTVTSLRDLMLFHLDPIDDRRARTKEARSLLRFMQTAMKDVDTAYARFMREECDLLLGLSPDYLAHDHLEEVNEPFYFTDFMKMAHEASLQYVADASLSSMYLANFPEHVASEIIHTEDLILREQYMDFFRNRRFRCSLLTHGNHQVIRDLDMLDVGTCYFASALKPVGEQDLNFDQDVAIQYAAGNIHFEAKQPHQKAALHVLWQHEGHRVSLPQLLAACADLLNMAEEQIETTDLIGLLRRLVLAGAVELCMFPSRSQNRVAPCPEVWWLARAEALKRQYVTSLNHEPVSLTQPMRVLFQLLDGTRSIEGVEDAIMTFVSEGELSLPGQDDIKNATEMVALVQSWVSESLDKIRRKGFYV